MNWKWWFLIVTLDIFWAGLAFADKKQKEWPPMPPLDTLIGDTTGAITIRDSALIPTFGIVPMTGWGKAVYIDTNTFDRKYGLMVFFDPWNGGARDIVDLFSELRDKIEDDWGFQLHLVACRMTVASCRPFVYENDSFWLCRTFLMPDLHKPDSLKKLLGAHKWSYPVYRLKQPVVFDLPGGERPSSMVLASAKQDYVVGYMMFPSFDERMNKIQKLLFKPFLKRAFSVERKYLDKWKYVSSEKR